MIDDTLITMFALLAVLGLVFIVITVVLAVWFRMRGEIPDWAVPLREGFGDLALPLAFVVALTCTLGSLYLSEVKNLPPCDMCWYQRICMYPTALILGIASVRRDVSVRWYAIPLAVVGMGFSTYHYLIERFPDSISSSCTDDVPCSTVWIWKFHFLSIPGMAWVGFLLIITLLLLARPRVPSPDRESIDSTERTEEVMA